MSALRALLDIENPAFVSPNIAEVDEVSSRFGRRKAASSDDILCDKRAARRFVRPSASNNELDEMNNRQKQGIRLWNNIVTYLRKTLDKKEQPLGERSHRKCFMGSQLVSSIRDYLRAITGYEPTKDEVYCLCHKFVVSSEIEDVKTGRSIRFKDTATYRFRSQFEYETTWSSTSNKRCVRSKSTLQQLASTLKSWKERFTSNHPLPSNMRVNHSVCFGNLDQHARPRTHHHCVCQNIISNCHSERLVHGHYMCCCCYIRKKRASTADSPQTDTNVRQTTLPYRNTCSSPVHSGVLKNDQESSWTLYGFL